MLAVGQTRVHANPLNVLKFDFVAPVPSNILKFHLMCFRGHP